MKVVSVIIVNYNTAALCFRCIRSVLDYTAGIDVEIIVIDNHSPQRDIEEIGVLFPEVIFIRSDHNAGFGRAVNEAARQAQGKYLFLLNPDCQLRGPVLEYLYRFYEEQGGALSVGCLGVTLYDTAQKPVHSYGTFPHPGAYLRQKVKSLLSRSGLYTLKTMQRPRVKDFLPVDYITGADLFLARKDFERLSGFDPGFFMYFEETDLQWRMKQQGLQSYLIAAPVLVHEQGASKDSDAALQVMYRDSMFYYMRKHNSRPRFLLFRYLWLLLDLKTSWLKYTLKRSAPARL